MKELLDKLEALPSCDAEELQYMRKPGRVVFLSELRAIINEVKEEAPEPFGYFKAEPFGWTDCAEADEGAFALYEYPSIPAGYALVPLEPTEEMLKAGCEAGLDINTLMDDAIFSTDKAVYKAMINQFLNK